jgi:hypothetical protein
MRVLDKNKDGSIELTDLTEALVPLSDESLARSVRTESFRSAGSKPSKSVARCMSMLLQVLTKSETALIALRGQLSELVTEEAVTGLFTTVCDDPQTQQISLAAFADYLVQKDITNDPTIAIVLFKRLLQSRNSRVLTFDDLNAFCTSEPPHDSQAIPSTHIPQLVNDQSRITTTPRQHKSTITPLPNFSTSSKPQSGGFYEHFTADTEYVKMQKAMREESDAILSADKENLPHTHNAHTSSPQQYKMDQKKAEQPINFKVINIDRQLPNVQPFDPLCHLQHLPKPTDEQPRFNSREAAKSKESNTHFSNTSSSASHYPSEGSGLELINPSHPYSAADHRRQATHIPPLLTSQRPLSNGFHMLFSSLLHFESRLELIRVALSHSRDFSVSALFDALASSGFIHLHTLRTFLSAIRLTIDETDLSHLFSHLSQGRVRISFDSFCQLFYPASKAQFEIMRTKMYASHDLPPPLSRTSRRLLREFFSTLAEVAIVKHDTASVLTEDSFTALLHSLQITDRQYITPVDLDACPRLCSYPADIRYKVFDAIDKTLSRRIGLDQLQTLISSS